MATAETNLGCKKGFTAKRSVRKKLLCGEKCFGVRGGGVDGPEEYRRHIAEGRCGFALTDDSAVDNGGKLLRSVSEVVAHWREGQYDVQVLSDELNEELPTVLAIGHKTLGLHLVRHVINLKKECPICLRAFLRVQNAGHVERQDNKSAALDWKYPNE